jgi:hypothetical protein
VLQQNPILGVAPLDQLLNNFCAPAPIATAGAPERSSQDSDEDGDSHGLDDGPARRSTLLLSRSRRWKPVVVELTSTLPASGKTNLLYLVTALAVLPRHHGGRGTTVVWFDLDGRLSARRLREVMYGVVPTSASSQDGNQKSAIAAEALRHVHVFRPQSSSQLMATLDSLPSYLLHAGTHSSMNRCVSLLILDPASAFYWQDRFDQETARLEYLHNAGNHQVSRTAAIIAKLKTLQKEFNCAVALSTASAMSTLAKPAPAASCNRDSAGPAEPRSTSPWTAFATITLILSRDRVPRFTADMTLSECLRDQPQRQKAVAQGRFLVDLDRGGSEGWSNKIGDAIRRMRGGGSFALRIGTMSVATLFDP